MAGISVPQHKIFKISTAHLKEYNWDLTITEKEAFRENELVCLFDSQMFRLIDLILESRGQKFPYEDVDYTKYVMSLVITDGNVKDFNYAVNNSIKINGVTFKCFVGTTGGLKKNSVLMVNEEILDELNYRTESRTIATKLVPAKYEAYKALTCSSSQPIPDPEKILVVSDVITQYIDTVIELDDTVDTVDNEPLKTLLVDELLENNGSDGFNLCTIEYMEKCCEALGIDYITGGLCLRNKWLKGMMYPFPIKEFVQEYNNGNSIVKDIWGNDIDLNEVDLILTESSLKLWSSYSSIDDYVDNYIDSGYTFSVTKISPHVLEDERDLNYQYLQSYDFTDEDIEELCKPTIDFLQNAMGNRYDDAIKFLGIGDNTNDYGWQHGLKTSSYMLKDPYIIDCIHRLIKKKIDEAKIGKLICNGNFQIFSNDPVCLMEHICGLEVKGLLKADECYSSYWLEPGHYSTEILAFRSPMTCHNNIRKLAVIDNEDTRFWYQYMYNILIVNSFDSFMKAENGEDADGDANFTTNNDVLLRNYRKEHAISCVQKSAVKYDITPERLRESNSKAFGNKVGTITNYVTSMLEVQSRFPKGSIEYEELEYRIECGQLYQQNCLDAIKGIIAKPMPNYWSSRMSCKIHDNSEYLLSLCADKKPYFMIYRYAEEKRKYKAYLEKNSLKCIHLFQRSIDDLLNADEATLSQEEINFKLWYLRKLPVGIGKCAMNRICWHVENKMNGYQSKLKKSSDFDYTILKNKMYMTAKRKETYSEYMTAADNLCKQYVKKIAMFKCSGTETNDKDDAIVNREQLKQWAKEELHRLCPDVDMRLNVVLDLCYGKNCNKQFCWDTVGKLIIHNLENINNENENNDLDIED